MDSTLKMRSFGFKLDTNTIRKIVFEKDCAVNQVFVEVVKLSQNSSSIVLDSRFMSNLRKVIMKCSNNISYSDSVRILVCLIVAPENTSTEACSLLSSLQHL